jgi:GNAT superfamily N-acetyltransferase
MDSHYDRDSFKDYQLVQIRSVDQNALFARTFARVFSMPDFRLRGLGLKVTRAIAELARDRGIRYLVGGGTAEGMNVYRKAKIREIGKSQRWIFSTT